MFKLLVFLLLLCSFSVPAEQSDTHAKLTSVLESIRLENRIPAMAVAVISSGEMSYIHSFGAVDSEQNNPTTKESLFRVASITKLFTAQAIMQLVEKGEIDLSDNVGQFLPLFAESAITIEQLLTHASGLSDSIRPVAFSERRSIDSYLKLVNGSIRKQIKPANFEYSDTNFNILGAVISAVSGQKYEQYVHQNIIVPAGMDKTNYFNGVNDYRANAEPTKKGKLIREREQRPYDLSFNPSEGLISNIGDVSDWLVSTLAKDTAILSTKTYETMMEPRVKTSWGDIYMGLGWQLYESGEERIARHPGSIRGYKSLVMAYPDKKNALVLLTNSSDAPRWDIAKAITRAMKESPEWE